MKTATKVIGIVALVLFFGAGLSWWCCESVYRQYHQARRVVLEAPIRLEDSFVLARPFTVDLTAKYEVKIVCRATIPFQTLNQALTKELGADCVVTDGERRVDAGDSAEDLRMWYSDDEIVRPIAAFDATPGAAYMLAFHVTRDLPELASTQPMVKVSGAPHTFKPYFVRASLYAHLTIGLLLIGLVCALVFFVGCVYGRFKKRRVNVPP